MTWGTEMRAVITFCFAVILTNLVVLTDQAFAQTAKPAAAQAAEAYDNGDYTAARRLAEPSCAKGSQGACAIMAMLHLQGRAVPANAALGRELAATACDRGSQLGCLALGLSYQKGLGISQDLVAAAAFYERACKAGEPRGCHWQADLYFDGLGTPVDKGRAAALYSKACALGYGPGCNSLGWFHFNGEVFRKDLVQAATIYQKGCNLGSAKSCRASGFMYLNGQGVAKSYPRAVQLYQLACRKNDQQACSDIAKVQKVAAENTPQRAAAAGRGGAASGGAPTPRQIRDALVYESTYGVPTVGDAIGMMERYTDYENGISRTSMFGVSVETRFAIANVRCTSKKAGEFICSFDQTVSSMGITNTTRRTHTFVNQGKLWRSPTYQAAMIEAARKNAARQNSQRNCTVQGFGTLEGPHLADQQGLRC